MRADSQLQQAGEATRPFFVRPVIAGEGRFAARTLIPGVLPATGNYASGPRVAAIDGLRGLAISFVVLYHYFIFFNDFPARTVPAYLLAAGHFFLGGVDLFFVLSGFLIGGILLRVKNSPNYFSTFYSRRALRILPLYALVVALAPFLARNVASFGDPLPYWTYLTFTQNIATAATGGWGIAWLGVTWSLALEEQFYLVAPFVIKSISEHALKILIGACIVGAPLLRLSLAFWFDHGNVAALTLMPARLDAIVLGIAVALIARSQEARARVAAHRKLIAFATLAVFGLGAVAASREAVYSTRMLGFGYSWLAFAYAGVLLLTVVCPWAAHKRLLEWNALTFIGRRAYAVYLFHVPVLMLAFALAGRLPTMGSMNDVIVSCCAIAIVLAVANLSWYLLEGPLLKSSRHYVY
jgi:peptidoglycan/LPS O-acetylase OafA/YrhL